MAFMAFFDCVLTNAILSGLRAALGWNLKLCFGCLPRLLGVRSFCFVFKMQKPKTKAKTNLTT